MTSGLQFPAMTATFLIECAAASTGISEDFIIGELEGQIETQTNR